MVVVGFRVIIGFLGFRVQSTTVRINCKHSCLDPPETQSGRPCSHMVYALASINPKPQTLTRPLRVPLRGSIKLTGRATFRVEDRGLKN